jgi:hypothetical protein
MLDRSKTRPLILRFDRFLSLCTGPRGIWLTSKLSWIADFVVAHEIFNRLMYSLTVFLSLRDFDLHFLSLYAGFPGILLTSERPWIADFVAAHGTPGHLSYLETTSK